MEIEAKFVTQDGRTFEAISRLNRLGNFQVVRRGSERQRNTYLDTEDLRLKRAHVALRLREAAGRVELTFKQEIENDRGISKRIEITQQLKRSQIPPLFEGRLVNRPLRFANRVAGGRPLKPIFTLVTFRRKRTLAFKHYRVELDLDRVVVKRKAHSERLEVEVENIKAPAHLYRSILSALQSKFSQSLRPSRISKYQYGLRFR